MLELRSAPLGLRRYLHATRGSSAEYLLYPTDRMSRFFGDCLEGWDSLDVDMSHIRLIFVNSHRGDIEHLHFDEGSCIIFDQSLLELLGLVSDSAIRSMSIGTAPSGPFPSILSAFYAARNLALGSLFDAVFDANICRSLRRRDPRPYSVDEQRRNAWVELQGCFTIGHELMHSKLSDSDGEGNSDSVPTLASIVAEDYEQRMLPHVRHMDELDASREEGDWEDQWRLAPGSEDSLTPKAVKPNLSWEAQLKWITQTQDSFGQEVLCDYGAALFVARNLGNNVLSPDECLLACYVALVARLCMQVVERRILAHTPSVPEMSETIRIATELRTRIQFLRIALAPLVRNGAYKDISRTSDDETLVKQRVSEQWGRFDATLRHLNETWTWPLVRLAAGGDRLGPKNEDRGKWPDDIDLSSLVEASQFVRSSFGVQLSL
jgi:hypothetical protein